MQTFCEIGHARCVPARGEIGPKTRNPCFYKVNFGMRSAAKRFPKAPRNVPIGTPGWAKSTTHAANGCGFEGILECSGRNIPRTYGGNEADPVHFFCEFGQMSHLLTRNAPTRSRG
jgi:hypothetical protein